MHVSSAHDLLWLSQVHHYIHHTIEALVGLIAILFAIAIRRRNWIFTWPGFAMIGVGLLVDVAAHFVAGDPTLLRTLEAIGLTLFLWGVIHLIYRAVGALRPDERRHSSSIFRDIVFGILYLLALMFAIEQDFHVNPTSLVFTSGVLAAILGFGLQETLGNIFSGVTLQLQRPFAPGDWVKSDQRVGRIKGVGWRSTTVVTRANERLEIPNALVAKNTLTNYGTGHVIDEIAVGLAYDQPPNRVRDVILRVLADIPGVLQEPTPEILAWEYGDSAIKYRVKYWLADYEALERVRDKVVTSLWYVLRRHHIDIPYPIRTLEVRQQGARDTAQSAFERQVISELREFDFLRALGDHELAVLVPGVNLHEFGAGEILVRQGEPGDTIYLIRRGTVEVIARGENGNSVPIAEMTRPQFFGEAAMMSGEPRNATVRARTDVEVLEIGRESFSPLFKQHPEAAEHIAEIVAARLAGRLAALARIPGPDGQREGTHWLFAKMRAIFDF